MSTYTNEAAVEARIGARRLLGLLDRDRDGTADDDVLDKAIARAGRIIRMKLRQRFGSNVDSIAAIDDDPVTPGEVQEIAVDLVLFDLYSWMEPGGRDAEYHKELAFEALRGLREADFDFPIGRAAAHEGRTIAVYSATDPVFSGTTSSGADRNRGI